jgi:hypothetical protein
MFPSGLERDPFEDHSKTEELNVFVSQVKQMLLPHASRRHGDKIHAIKTSRPVTFSLTSNQPAECESIPGLRAGAKLLTLGPALASIWSEAVGGSVLIPINLQPSDFTLKKYPLCLRTSCNEFVEMSALELAAIEPLVILELCCQRPFVACSCATFHPQLLHNLFTSLIPVQFVMFHYANLLTSLRINTNRANATII